MAKGVGLIGNFKGKVGNTVGYSLKDSNNKQTQGIRVYQPVVRNPKTYAQAEQRMKLAPINATYRALKMIIDRGQEGLAYGNKSRLAFLSDAIKKFNGGYFEKGAAINMPAIIGITKGSLSVNLAEYADGNSVAIDFQVEVQSAPTTMGALSAALLSSFPTLKIGDQLTYVLVQKVNNSVLAVINSIVLTESTDNTAIPSWLTATTSGISVDGTVAMTAFAIIVSREGDNGAHLRSTAKLQTADAYNVDILTDAAKEAAIVSYMSQGANTDWAEESLMQ